MGAGKKGIKVMQLDAFIDFCSGAVSEEMLAMQVFDFLVNNKLTDNLFLVRHNNRREPFKLIQKTAPSVNEAELYKRCYPLQAFNDEHGHYYKSSKSVCFISTDAPTRDEPFYILIFDGMPDGDTLSLLRLWKSLSKSIHRHTREGNVRIRYKYADLISQLLHDVHGILELFPEDKSEEAQTRWNYQEQVNKKVLRYVRDLELFKSDINMGTFLKDTLALVEAGQDKIRVNHNGIDIQISMDVELMAEALSEIIKNALWATGETPEKVEISLECEKVESPFFTQDWLKLIIRDYGTGIIPDFLPYVKKPFFTTLKYMGHPGFGLSIAEKIVQAHGGYLEVQSIKGHHTDVMVFLPVENILCGAQDSQGNPKDPLLG